MDTTATQENIDSLCHSIQHMDVQDSQEYLSVVHQRLAVRGIQETYSAALVVKMLSGEMVPLGIHTNQATKMLPYGFVAQLGYNPSVVGRLSFLDENGQSVLQEKSWLEVYGSVGKIPVVYILIQEEEDKDRDAKLLLLQQVIREKHVRSKWEEEDIWSLYLSWNMYEHPSPYGKKHNRWTKLAQFVEDHPHVFLEMTQEEVQARKQADLLEKEREREIRMITEWIALRDAGQYTLNVRMQDPAFVMRREEVRAHLIPLVEQHPDCSFLADTLNGLQNRRTLRTYFTVQELVDMGVPTTRLSLDWWITRWHEMKVKAEAYLTRPNQ
jgi:hypothetical protein